MDQHRKRHKKSIALNGIVIGLFCITLLFIVIFEDNSKQVSQNEQLQLVILKNLTLDQSTQIVQNILYISQKMVETKQQSKQKVNKQITHGLIQNKLKGQNLMIDHNIISLIQKMPEIQHLIFEIMDNNNNKEVTQKELEKAIHGVYKHSNNQELINAFTNELYSKINESKPFKFDSFQTYFNQFLLSLLDNKSDPFQNTPPFEKEDIKGLVLYLASGRKNWDKCLLTVFSILNINKDEYVTLEEIGQFLSSISPQTWQDAKPYLESILGYMRVTGCSNGEKFNLGQLITFGELIRPYMSDILQKYVK